MFIDSKAEITVDLSKAQVAQIKDLFDKHVDEEDTFGQLRLELGAASDETSTTVLSVRIYGTDKDNKDVQQIFEIRD